jgi:hypothetical protein
MIREGDEVNIALSRRLVPPLLALSAVIAVSAVSSSGAPDDTTAFEQYLRSGGLTQMSEDAAYAAYLRLNGGVDPALFAVTPAPTEPVDDIKELLPTQEKWDENKRKADANDRDALCLLGLAYAEGYRVERDPERAIACFQAAQNCGTPRRNSISPAVSS